MHTSCLGEKQVPNVQLAALESAAEEGGVPVRIFTDKRDLENILEYVVAGNAAQMNDKAFVTQLKDLIRFSESAAIHHRDRLFTASSGNPTPPGWHGKIAFNVAFTMNSENDKYRDHIRSSASVIAFISEQDKKENWINAGCCYQRFALQATALGLRHAFVNQLIEAL